MPAALVKSIAEETGISLAEAEKRWDKAKEITLEETDLKESDGESYWKYVTGVFKKSMGLKEDQVLEKATAYMQFLSPAERVAPAQDNMQWVLARRANYVDAMFRKDTGWISFLWGASGSKSSDYADGYGIANILAKGGQGTEDALLSAAETLARGRIKRKYGPPGNKKIEMIWRGNVVHLAWHRGRKTWYLAGWPGLKYEAEAVEEETEAPVLESSKIDREANKAASSPTNKEPEPTDAQKESGNYKKGHVRVLGLDIAIENPKGSERSGTDRNGKEWASKLEHHYGYFKRSEGKDGDQVDVFLGPDPNGADKVFVVNQVNPDTGKFDEHKVMMGFGSEKEAKAAYLSNYEKGWKGLGSITPLSVENFKHWLKDGNTKKPVERDKILEAAIDDWKKLILSAKTLDDIQTVFVRVFPDDMSQGKEPWEIPRDTLADMAQGVRNKDGSFSISFNGKPLGTPSMAQKYNDIEDHFKAAHEYEVKQALAEGKPVPEEVLADYPSLKSTKDVVVQPDPTEYRVRWRGPKKGAAKTDPKFAEYAIQGLEGNGKWRDDLTNLGKESAIELLADRAGIDADQARKMVEDVTPKDETQADLPPLRQVGQTQDIMGVKDAVVTHAIRLDGVDYELYRAGDAGYIRVFDADSGNTVGIESAPEFTQALAKYAGMIKANGGDLKTASQGYTTPKKEPRFQIGDNVRPTKESGLNPSWGGKISHIELHDGVEYLAVDGRSQHYPETDFEKVEEPAPAEKKPYRYGLQLRPPTNGGVPQGLKYEWDKNYRDPDKGILHGVITTGRKLTGKEIERFDLVDLNEGIMESAKGTIFEMAVDPKSVDPSNWEHAIDIAEDMDDVSNIFKILFGAPTDADASPYFKNTKDSVVLPLDKLVAREPADPARLETARSRMANAKSGTGEKRGPIHVLAMGNGKYKVLDGNTTLQALKDLEEGKAVVEIKKTLKQPGVETIDDLYEQAEEAQPLFMEYMEKWGKKTGGKVMVRPGLKSRKRTQEKVAADKDGTMDGMKDILAGTLVFDTVDQVLAAYKMIESDPSIYRVKNRYTSPMGSGYRDIFMNIALPNGHIAEMQLNTQTMIDAKEYGLGHKIYDITRQLAPISKKAEGDTRFIARGAMEELDDLSRKVYTDAAARCFSARSLARATAKDTASDSEMTRELDRILKALSSSSISNHPDLSLPDIENSDQDPLSKQYGDSSSYNKNSKSDITFPPGDDVTENLSESLENVKHIVGNPATAFLYDNSPVRVQYAAVEVEDLKTSHDDDIALADAYPQEVQPRQRDRGAMQLQIKEMANKLNPERMAASPQASTGAPIVGPDMAVESGNGRTMALRAAYGGGEKGTEYREWLIQHAQEFGMTGADIAKMEKPVLVRMRVGKVKDRAQFARDANKDELAQMSPVEVAKMDAETLTEGDLSIFAPSEDGNIAASSNAAFINAFVKKLGVNESAGYLTADGRPTKQLIDRIQAAIFQKAYEDESVLAMVAEEANPDLRNILNGLTFAAKDFVQARAFADDFDGIDIPKHAIAAGNLIRKARKDQISVEGILSQSGIFSEIPEGTAAFAQFIDKNIRSGKRLGRVFQVAADILKEHLSMRDQESLFDKPEPPTEAEIIKQAIAKVEEENEDKQQGLFEGAITESGAIRRKIVALIDKIAPRYLTRKNAKLFKNTALDLLSKGVSIGALPGALIEAGFPNKAVQTFIKEFRAMRHPIFEEAVRPLPEDEPWKFDIRKATALNDIVSVLTRLFGAATQKVKKSLTDYKDNENSDYGLKVRGVKAREKINEQVKEVLERVNDPAKLTGEEIELLKQYSGKGGLTQNSQYEYYTPTHVAEGLWDAMLANGFENGNVLDPSTGAGVFSGTKPKGTLMTGCDVDPTGSKVAALLNPEDNIENKPLEQLIMETPDNTFDGVITNVPFGDARGACAHDDPAYKDEKRIERYFILRTLDKIKPGKLACFVVPTNIVGNRGGKWEQFRTAVSKKAEFLGAHKLPSKTFGGKGGQGTDAVTDVIVLKKHPEDLLDKIDSLQADTLRATNVLWDEFIKGEYWKGEGRKFIMGKYMPKVEGDRWSRETVDGDIDNETMKKKLALRFNSRIDWEALEVAEPVVKNYADGDRRVINGEEYEMQAGEWVKVQKTESTDDMVLEAAKYGAKTYGELQGILSSPKSALQLTADQAFAVWKAYPDLMTPLQKNSIEFAMSQPKDEYREQIWRGSIIGGMIGRLQNEVNQGGDNDPDAMRTELQDLITAEIQKYGHPKNNKGLVITGENSKTFGLFVNAMDETGNFSDLISGNMAADTLRFDSTNLQSIVEYLYAREGISTIELEDIQRLYGGTRKIESLGDLTDVDGIALTPDGMVMPLGWYCSGDIYPKMRAMTKAMADEPDERIKAKYQKQIDTIMERREVTAPENIKFGLQQKWFSRKYIVDFLKEIGYPRINYGVFKNVEVEDPVTGEKTTEKQLENDYENPFGEFYGYADNAGWLKQFNKFLNGKNVTSSKKEIKEEYQKKVAALQDQFNVWMQQHPDIDQIAEKYNQKFNGYLPFDYDGSIELEGVSPQVHLHDFQAKAVQRLSEEGRGCLAFDVGLGKTYSALGLYAYNKQMGRSKKTCIVVPNAVLANWYHSSKKFLGNHDGVLTVGFKPKMGKDGNIAQEVVKDEEGNPKKNKYTGELEYHDVLIRSDSKEDVWEDMWKIPQSNVSLVIMTKEKFGTIPMRPKTKRGFTDKMVDRALISEKQADKAVNENSRGAERTAVSYQEDKDRLNLEQKYADEGTRKKGELPYFEDMGFTDVIVDECFPYDTMVETITGPMKIGDIVSNKIKTSVLTFDIKNGSLTYKPITQWFTNKRLTRLVKITHSQGSLICTENHKIWTLEEGYVEAKALLHHSLMPNMQTGIYGTEGWKGDSDILQSKMLPSVAPSAPNVDQSMRGMRGMRKNIPIQIEGAKSREGKATPFLLEEMQCHLALEAARCQGGICRKDQPNLGLLEGATFTGIFDPNEIAQPYERSKSKSEDDQSHEGQNIFGARGERRAHEAANHACGEARPSDGIPHCNSARERSIRVPSELLQGGFGNPQKENCNRSGRTNAQTQEVEIFGPPKNGGSGSVRVESVEILERGSFEQHGLGDQDHNTVYDIEVADTHNYFASGILVSNCHEFKNSYEAGEQTKNVAYLPTAPSAKRALDMAMKMNVLRDKNNGRGAYLLSATPVTNSPFEIYNILSLCCPIEEFERFGVYTVDDFVRVFGQIETVDKVKVSGEIASMDGLTGFQNLDGLRNLFHKYTNMKNAEDVNLPLPPHDETHDMVELTEEQMNVYSELRERAKEAAKPGSGESMFAVMRDMDRVTTDMDLYRHTMTFHFKASDKARVDGIMDKMPESIQTTIQEDGESAKVEVPFTHESHVDGDTYVVVVPESYEDLVIAGLPEAGIEEPDVGHPVTPKYAKLIERLRKHFEAKGKQLIFTEEKSQHQKVRRLIINQVPVWKDVISVINADTASGTNLKKIENAYNSGKYRIIVANRKAEVGVNLQKGTTAIHHLTLPWTPASIQQRNGRGVRQGNKADHISIYYYLGKGSFDQYRLDLLQKKSNWMRELFTGKDATAENANAFQADEYVDMLEDDPEEAKKRRMERLAKKAAERKAREDQASANTLQVLANNTHVLKNLDATKEADRAKLEERVPKLEQTLSNYEARIAETQNEQVKADLRDKAARTRKQLENAKTRLANLDRDYNTKKTDLEARVKQATGLLKHRAKKTGIPFDESLIDHPENAVVTLSGKVIAKGEFYEVSKGETHFQITNEGMVFEITDVNPEGKWLRFENALDGGYISIARTHVQGEDAPVIMVKDWPTEYMKKVSYSKAELDLKKMLSKEIRNYEDVMEFDKDVFLDHVNELDLSEWTECLMRLPDKGLVFDRLNDNSRGTLVYPEPQNEDFRKEMCELYLRMDRAGEAGYDIEGFMEELFGDQWHDIAMEYGKTATESEIREAAAKVLKNTRESILTNYDIDGYQDLEYALHRNQRDLANAIAQNVDGDNGDDIDRIAYECIEAEMVNVERELDRLKKEATEKEKEELKKHPDYKEVPPEVEKAFRDLGITVKTNTTNMVIPGFRGRRGTPVKPFKKWFFQDENGKRGRLFKMKNILKTRYEAKFFTDADDVFRGAWWHVASTEDLQEIYELLA